MKDTSIRLEGGWKGRDVAVFIMEFGGALTYLDLSLSAH